MPRMVVKLLAVMHVEIDVEDSEKHDLETLLEESTGAINIYSNDFESLHDSLKEKIVGELSIQGERSIIRASISDAYENRSHRSESR